MTTITVHFNTAIVKYLLKKYKKYKINKWTQNSDNGGVIMFSDSSATYTLLNYAYPARDGQAEF